MYMIYGYWIMDLSLLIFFHEKACLSKKFRAAPKLQTLLDTSCIGASKTLSLFAWVALTVRLKLHETCNREFVILLCWSWMLIIAFLCVLVETSIFCWLVSLFQLQLSICYLYFKFIYVLLNYRDMRNLMLPVCENTRNLQKWKI